MSIEALFFTLTARYYRSVSGLKKNGRPDKRLFEWLQWKAIFIISGEY